MVARLSAETLIAKQHHVARSCPEWARTSHIPVTSAKRHATSLHGRPRARLSANGFLVGLQAIEAAWLRVSDGASERQAGTQPLSGRHSTFGHRCGRAGRQHSGQDGRPGGLGVSKTRLAAGRPETKGCDQ